MIANLLAILVFINFSWNAPTSEQNVTKVEVRVAPSVAQHDQGQVFDAGLPPVVNGRQSFTAVIDTNVNKYGWVGFRNSFGVEEGSPLYMGKPQPPTGALVTP